MSTNAPPLLIDRPALVRGRLRAAPDGPGVYLMRDASARVIYVGKAANVRNRLRSYFTSIDTQSERVATLVQRVIDFEVVACANEREALLLENTFIKRYRPRFNIRLKDDKNYLYLKIPQPGALDAVAPATAREEFRKRRGKTNNDERASRFPRPYYTRRLARDGARYYGPYTSAQSLRTTVKSLRGIFPFRTCSDEIFRRGRVCLDYHIKRCAGPCEGRIDETAYAALLDQVELFMDGQSSAVVRDLNTQMKVAADNMNFELAARYRDRVRAIDRIRERQAVLGGARTNQDYVAIHCQDGRGMVALLFAREGKVVAVETHELEGVADVTVGECLGNFVTQYYSSSPKIPRVLHLSDQIDDAAMLAEFLSQERGSPVDIRVPQRGSARRLIEQAKETARTALQQTRIKEDFDSEKAAGLLEDLQTKLDLPDRPQRIECYDISNTMGTNSVGSMVVFDGGRPRPAHYRHFRIKTVAGSDDFASMRETLRRRFGEYLRRQQENGPSNQGADDVPVDDPDGSNGESIANGTDHGRHKKGTHDPDTDDSFGILPDLLLIDGGKGQLSTAVEVLEEAGLTHIPVYGLAKRNEELFRPQQADPIILAKDSPTLFLVQRVRDEAHRFAITHHRVRRTKSALRSKLDIVSGLGPVRRRALLRHFGSLEAIRQATVEELCTVPGIPQSLALRIKELI